ncbi:hypothetical protein K438DRAFT_1760423 [Mycena galopus ATCC 62051]|nr:hypothetical protein K438DRAFT_1760423 [Mycena galopus ATCC 62051]
MRGRQGACPAGFGDQMLPRRKRKSEEVGVFAGIEEGGARAAACKGESCARDPLGLSLHSSCGVRRDSRLNRRVTSHATRAKSATEGRWPGRGCGVAPPTRQPRYRRGIARGPLSKYVPEGEAIILSVADNFHGRTLGVVSMSTDPSARTDFGPFLPNVGPTFVDAEAPGGKRVIRFGEIAERERALAPHGPRVTAFLVEPVQGEAGALVENAGPTESRYSAAGIPLAQGPVCQITDLIEFHSTYLRTSDLVTWT